MASPNAERVFLRIPARQPYAPLVKAAAAALARRLDMSFADLDDLRLVTDQAVLMLLDGLEADPQQAPHIDVVIRTADDRIEFEAARSSGGGLSERAVRLFTRITHGLSDELRVDTDGAAVWLSKTASNVR